MKLLYLLRVGISALAAPPTPKSWFGHDIGTDRTVLDWDKVVGYFQALAERERPDSDAGTWQIRVLGCPSAENICDLETLVRDARTTCPRAVIQAGPASPRASLEFPLGAPRGAWNYEAQRPISPSGDSAVSSQQQQG